MKRMIVLILGICLILSYMSCSMATVPAGNVGVKVYLLGKEKGVDSEVLGVGRYWIGINEQVYIYPTYIQLYRFTQGSDCDSPNDEAFYFQNKDGVKCNLDLSIQAHADANKVSILFQRYRDDLRDVIKINLKTFILNQIQNYGSGLSIEELYSTNKVQMIKCVEASLKKEVEPYGILIDNVSLLSDIRFPKEVEDAIVGKIRATQEAMQRENEVQKAKAEAEIKVVNAKADSEAIKLKQQSITANLIQYEAIQKWNGVLPIYVMGNGSLPLLNIK